jgi:hypothetical protein
MHKKNIIRTHILQLEQPWCSKDMRVRYPCSQPDAAGLQASSSHAQAITSSKPREIPAENLQARERIKNKSTVREGKAVG